VSVAKVWEVNLTGYIWLQGVIVKIPGSSMLYLQRDCVISAADEKSFLEDNV
jgi:hypothetical protein